MPAPCCRHSLEQECRVLLVHGVLHLLGHDHELSQQARSLGMLLLHSAGRLR